MQTLLWIMHKSLLWIRELRGPLISRRRTEFKEVLFRGSSSLVICSKPTREITRKPFWRTRRSLRRRGPLKLLGSEENPLMIVSNPHIGFLSSGSTHMDTLNRSRNGIGLGKPVKPLISWRKVVTSKHTTKQHTQPAKLRKDWHFGERRVNATLTPAAKDQFGENPSRILVI